MEQTARSERIELVVWRDSFSVQNYRTDTEHKSIITIINKLYAAIRNRQEEVLNPHFRAGHDDKRTAGILQLPQANIANYKFN